MAPGNGFYETLSTVIPDRRQRDRPEVVGPMTGSAANLESTGAGVMGSGLAGKAPRPE